MVIKGARVIIGWLNMQQSRASVERARLATLCLPGSWKDRKAVLVYLFVIL